MFAQEEGPDAPQAVRVLDEAEAILRKRLARQDDNQDAFLLADVLSAAEGQSPARQALAVRQEIVALHAGHWPQSREQLPRKRVDLARTLDEVLRKSEAEEQLLLAASDLGRLPKAQQYAVNALALDHGWFLLSSTRPREAAQRVAPYLALPAKEKLSYYSHEREARLLAAIAARSEGKWQEVSELMAPVHTFVVRAGGNRLSRWVNGQAESTTRHDLRAGLLLVEAQRKLGQGEAADKLVRQMLTQYTATKETNGIACTMAQGWDRWRKDLDSALIENEKREFKCEDPPPPLNCPAPAASGATPPGEKGEGQH